MGEENDVGACRRRSVRKRGVTRMPSFGLDAFARPAGNGDTALDQRHAALAAQILAKADPCIGVYRQAMMDVNRDNVERVTKAMQGPPRPDVAEARRAFEIGRQAANARLAALKDEVRAEYPGDEAIAPVPVSELALAWVRAV